MRRVPVLLFVALGSMSACSQTVDGDTSDPTYGDVTLTVVTYDDAGEVLSREVREGDGAELIAPLDRELYAPIEVDGAATSDPSRLFAASEARIGGVTLARDAGGVLMASGDSFLHVRSAERHDASVAIGVDGGRFDIAVAGELSAASADRFLATAVIRTVRGEALLADDCRPDCIYDFNPGGWLCGPMRDVLTRELGGDCAGPFTPEEWAAIEDQTRNDAKREYCYDMWYIPRPICEWGYDMAADSILPYLEPDASGMVCAGAFYDRCTAAH